MKCCNACGKLLGEGVELCPYCGRTTKRLAHPDRVATNTTAPQRLRVAQPPQQTYTPETTSIMDYVWKGLSILSVTAFCLLLLFQAYRLFLKGDVTDLWKNPSYTEQETVISPILPFTLQSIPDYDSIPEEYYEDYIMAYGACFAFYMLARQPDLAPEWLESISFTWNSTLPANSNILPMDVVLNGEHLHQGNISQYPLETLGYCGEYLRDLVTEMTNLENYIQSLQQNPNNIDLSYQRYYGATGWSQVDAFTLDLERSATGEIQWYTSSSHWAQFGIPTLERPATPMISVLERQYQEYHEFTDLYTAYDILQGVYDAMDSLAPSELEGEFLTWDYATGVTFLDETSPFAMKMTAIMANIQEHCSVFGQSNPITLCVGIDLDGNPYVYLDTRSNLRWAQELGIQYGPLV